MPSFKYAAKITLIALVGIVIAKMAADRLPLPAAAKNFVKAA